MIFSSKLKRSRKAGKDGNERQKAFVILGRFVRKSSEARKKSIKLMDGTFVGREKNSESGSRAWRETN